MIDLVTTGLQKTFKENQNQVFLGDWCIPVKEKFNGSKRFNIIPYHWENTEIMKKDMNYVYQTYNNFLPIMKDYLNKFHNLNMSTDYWKFLIGPWLFMFIHVLYDRYLSIDTASKKLNSGSDEYLYNEIEVVDSIWIEHITRKEETLYSIAESKLGSANSWSLIYKWNENKADQRPQIVTE